MKIMIEIEVSLLDENEEIQTESQLIKRIEDSYMMMMESEEWNEKIKITKI